MRYIIEKISFVRRAKEILYMPKSSRTVRMRVKNAKSSVIIQNIVYTRVLLSFLSTILLRFQKANIQQNL